MPSVEQQEEVEEYAIVELTRNAGADLRVEPIKEWAAQSLGSLPPGFRALDASRPWIIYWAVHSLALLGGLHLVDEAPILETIRACQSPSGGFCGGPGQEAHMAATYAATAALATIGGERALDIVDREGLKRFLKEQREAGEQGGIAMTKLGETDSRGPYCALATSRLLNLDTSGFSHGLAEYLADCQTHEGGFAAEPGTEAHGGYTFCSLAACVLLDSMETIDTGLLEEWVHMRQGAVEGGFAGRTNKLVDACYAFWQCATLHLLRPDPAYNSEGLKRWLLECCQADEGGLQDKPGKGRDLYHTCYGLSGLSLAGHREALQATDPLVNVVQWRLRAWDGILSSRDGGLLPSHARLSELP